MHPAGLSEPACWLFALKALSATLAQLNMGLLAITFFGKSEKSCDSLTPCHHDVSALWRHKSRMRYATEALHEVCILVKEVVLLLFVVARRTICGDF